MIKTNIALPHRPDIIEINGLTGKIKNQDENNSRTTKTIHTESNNKTTPRQTVGTEKGVGTKTEAKTDGLNGIDVALDKAIELAAIKVIEGNPDMFQEVIADLIAKKLKDKLKDL